MRTALRGAHTIAPNKPALDPSASAPTRAPQVRRISCPADRCPREGRWRKATASSRRRTTTAPPWRRRAPERRTGKRRGARAPTVLTVPLRAAPRTKRLFAAPCETFERGRQSRGPRKLPPRAAWAWTTVVTCSPQLWRSGAEGSFRRIGLREPPVGCRTGEAVAQSGMDAKACETQSKKSWKAPHAYRWTQRWGRLTRPQDLSQVSETSTETYVPEVDNRHQPHSSWTARSFQAFRIRTEAKARLSKKTQASHTELMSALAIRRPRGVNFVRVCALRGLALCKGRPDPRTPETKGQSPPRASQELLAGDAATRGGNSHAERGSMQLHAIARPDDSGTWRARTGPLVRAQHLPRKAKRVLAAHPHRRHHATGTAAASGRCRRQL